MSYGNRYGGGFYDREYDDDDRPLPSSSGDYKVPDRDFHRKNMTQFSSISSYLLKTKKSDDPSAKLILTDGVPSLDLSSSREKETPKEYKYICIVIFNFQELGYFQ